jgi:hypothetical protein
MKKIDLGQSIQILANVGVIAGIIFLAVEISQNTTMVEAQMNQARTETAMAEAEAIYNSDSLLETLRDLDQGKDLTDIQKLRFWHYLRSFNRNQDNQLRQYDQGFLGDNIPRSIRVAVSIEIASRPLAREYWEVSKEIYTDEYIQLVDSILAGNSPGLESD